MQTECPSIVRVLVLLLAFTTKDWASSPDTWTVRNPQPTANAMFDVAYGNGQFVAVGDLGTIIASADGVNWTVCQSGTTNRLSAVTYGSGRFVAVSGDPLLWSSPPLNQTGIILASTDGLTWTQQLSPRQNPSQKFSSLVYGNGRFVLADEHGLLTSTNGVNWLPTLNESLDPAMVGIKLAYGSGQFVCFVTDVPTDSCPPSKLVTSTDGVHWVARSMVVTNGPITSVTYGNGLFVAQSSYGVSVDGQIVCGGVLYTSTEGINWVQAPAQSVPFSTATRINAISYGDGQFVAVGYGLVLTSIDGVDWVEKDLPSEFSTLWGITYGNNRFVAVGWAGFI